jgi:DNA polymerase III subunit delta'
MGFDAILAQEPAVQTLVRALKSGRVHHAYRFEGPPGVGKEMAALALAQALVCESHGPLACARCSACRRAVTFSEQEPRVPLHPDVIFLQRGLYSKSVLGASEATGISVEQVRRVVLGRAGFRPHEGRALVFIVRDADELTVQAANALLKTLEEPDPATHFVLITSRPNRLLDTVRSRTLAVRFGPLPDDVVARILAEHDAPPAAAPLAQGSASLALELSEEDHAEARDGFIRRALEAIDAPDLATAIDLMETRALSRDELRGQLSFLAQALALNGRDTAARAPDQAERAARRYGEVTEAMSELERNAQPALVLESMLLRLRRI